MGCDIHVSCERRRPDGSWEFVLGPVTGKRWAKDTGKCWKCEYPDEVPEDERGLPCTDCLGDGLHHDEFYEGRNYDVFAILADVRNGRGFAGFDTGDGFIPYDDPRGLPEDVSEIVKRKSDGWGSDGHSRTYFTLAELEEAMAGEWPNLTTTSRGVTSVRGYLLWKAAGGNITDDMSISTWISGPNIKIVSPEEMEKIVNEKKLTLEDLGPAPTDRWISEVEVKFDGVAYYTTISWQTNYAETMANFMEQVRRAGVGYKPEDVRFVMWFDN